MKKSRLIGGAVAGLLGLAVAFVGGWEGKRLVAYRDIVGVWTICYGETYNVKPSERRTSAECDEGLAKGLRVYEAGMRKCLDRPDAIPGKSYVAFVSLTWNIGIPAFCRSTVARRINAGDIAGACDAMLAWNRAGGRVVQGLVNRRHAERRLCREGVAEGRAGA